MNSDNDLLIIDGDIVLFQVGRVTEDKTDFGDQQMESFDIEVAKENIRAAVKTIMEKTGFDKENTIFAISSPNNFRKEYFPTYKGNRKKVQKPLGMEAMVKFLEENHLEFNLLRIDTLEADDCMGIISSQRDNVYIYSQDKDMKTVSKHLWCFKTNKFKSYTFEERIRYLYSQVLTGDAVDGYKGLEGIGKVKANKALKDAKDELQCLEIVHKMYFNKHKELAKDKLLEQIGQARILEVQDYIELLEGRTYNPYTKLGVTDEMLRLWEGV